MSCATWYEGTAQLLSWQKLDRICLIFILWAEPLTDDGGEETGVPRETHDDELQKMPHTKVRKFKPQPRLQPAL